MKYILLLVLFCNTLFSQEKLDVISTISNEIYFTKSIDIGDGVEVGVTTLGDMSHFIIIDATLPIDQVLMGVSVTIDNNASYIKINHENSNRVMFILSPPNCDDPEIKKAGSDAEIPVIIGKVIKGFWLNIYNHSTKTQKRIWINRSTYLQSMLETLTILKQSYYGKEEKTEPKRFRRT